MEYNPDLNSIPAVPPKSARKRPARRRKTKPAAERPPQERLIEDAIHSHDIDYLERTIEQAISLGDTAMLESTVHVLERALLTGFSGKPLPPPSIAVHLDHAQGAPNPGLASPGGGSGRPHTPRRRRGGQSKKLKQLRLLAEQRREQQLIEAEIEAARVAKEMALREWDENKKRQQREWEETMRRRILEEEKKRREEERKEAKMRVKREQGWVL